MTTPFEQGKKILVCGGRNYRDWNNLHEVLSSLTPACIVNGGANGADQLATQFGQSYGIPVVIVPANWKIYHRAAGPIRNKWMLDFVSPDYVVAFPGGRGTADMVNQARARNIPVWEVLT